MEGKGVFLKEKRDVLEMFSFSKMWFMAWILPLPQGLAGFFLRWGHFERLAWQELHQKKKTGGLSVSCVPTGGGW